MTMSPLRRFVLAAALWLPACFFLWAVLSSAVVWPMARGAELVLTRVMPDAVSAVEQQGSGLETETKLQTAAGPDQRVGVLVLTTNPMIYAWCFAVFAGLVMATPLEPGQRLRQFAVGFPVMWLTSTWGAVFDVFKLFTFDAGPLGQAAMNQAGLSADGVALGYQFGYLILPAVTPVALWVLQNREFLELLVGWREEPNGSGDGQSPASTPPVEPKEPS